MSGARVRTCVTSGCFIFAGTCFYGNHVVFGSVWKQTKKKEAKKSNAKSER